MALLKHIENNTSDDDLLKEYQRLHNQQTLAVLYLRYSDLVFGTCMKYFKNPETAQDAVMNIYQDPF